MNKAEYRTFLEKRRCGIGGSDVAGILGLSPWASPLSVFRDKVMKVERDEEQPSFMELGTLFEPVIAEYYERKSGRRLEVCKEFLRHPEHPYMIGNIDRYVYDDEKGKGVAELKCTGYHTKSDWREGPPIHYLLQLQHYLAITGLDWGVFVVLMGGQDVLWCDVERNEKVIAKITEACGEFWRRVESNDIPTADHHKSTREALLDLYPESKPGTSVALPEEAMDWDDETKEAKEEIKRLQKIIDGNNNRIVQAMAGAEVGVLPGEAGAYTHKADKRGRYSLRRKGD